MDADQVRVSDGQREAIVARLNVATGEGRLTLAEFGLRAREAYGARTKGELQRLVADLPARPANLTRPASSQVVPVGALKRSGRWRLDRDLELRTVVGAIKLDLRRAEVAAPEVHLHVKAGLGSVKVWIPHGVKVDVEGTSLLGSRQVEEGSGSGYPNAPLLRLTIDTGVGSVKVYRV